MEETRIIKVCFIAPKAYPLFNPSIKSLFGGAQLDLYLLAKELAKDKIFQVSFITADYGQQEIEKIDGVMVIKTLDFRQNSLTGTIKIWRGLHKADAEIYLQKTASLGTFLIALFCRLHKKAFIYRTASEQECNGTYLKQHPVQGIAFKWALKKASLVTTQNKIDQQGLEQSIGLESVVIPNGHPMPELKPDIQQRNTILWVGRSARVKRPDLFIDLAEKMSAERFTMICQRATGDNNYIFLKERASKVGNLQFIERVPFDEIDNYFQRAKVFVNTSDTEGFPNTFIQACKFATPILSFNANPDDFLTKYSCGLCCNGDENRLTEDLKSILAEKRRTEMGLNGRKYAEQYHNIEKIVERYKALFAELTKRSSAEQNNRKIS